ncbi:hypothetical protein MTZ49_01685 [Entomomonas sp. E2T0]|uniref:hypothetical protein n=1 Tax=Entomomonas sp. E2T0 TaxID=2930213 RepID=UPI0022285195|nr:hypothetical protein [Entomomonas sp. E2T0]UYZ84319.1 hypothetical protein MTZ49_01685 [Entomomonas sp. E2T0]
MIQIQCPCCAATFPLEAGFVEVDGKKLAALTGELQPALAKAALLYLRLFSPAKSALKNSKAIKLLDSLIILIKAGTVTNDARTNETKPATMEMWLAGLEQVTEQYSSLTLPLKNHNYLRAIVWGIASDPKQAQLLIPKAAKKVTSTQEEKNEKIAAIYSDLRLGLINEEQAHQLISQLKIGG